MIARRSLILAPLRFARCCGRAVRIAAAAAENRKFWAHSGAQACAIMVDLSVMMHIYICKHISVVCVCVSPLCLSLSLSLSLPLARGSHISCSLYLCLFNPLPYTSLACSAFLSSPLLLLPSPMPARLQACASKSMSFSFIPSLPTQMDNYTSMVGDCTSCP